MARATITVEEGDELKRLYADVEVATARAGHILATKGFGPEFSEADRATGLIWRRIREILQ